MIEITPVLHHSNGGIQINASTEVVTTRDDGTSSIILGLYAAGECTGGMTISRDSPHIFISVIGIHGTERLVGNGLLESIVFGTSAGTRAAKTAHHDANISTLAEWTPLKLRHRAKVHFLLVSPDNFFFQLPYLSVNGLSHLNKQGVNDIPTDLFEFCFELPSSSSVLNLPPGTAVAVRATINGSVITRHYSPISVSNTRGSVSLYLKSLPDRGAMSRSSLLAPLLPLTELLDTSSSFALVLTRWSSLVRPIFPR